MASKMFSKPADTSKFLNTDKDVTIYQGKEGYWLCLELYFIAFKLYVYLW